MLKRKKVLLTILIIFVLLNFASLLIFGYKSWGLFKSGNASKYSLDKLSVNESSSLKGKSIIFLGSSVTKGAASFGCSFVEYLEKIDGIIPTKEAVSGTTLVDDGKKSYIKRMKTIDNTIDADGFVCQLSTNDATLKKALGEISDSYELEEFDTQTITGAMEYIICYAKQTWDCPIVFYTNPYYDDENYQAMVDRLYELQDKWDIGIIDLWGNNDFNNLDKETRKLYMNDKIHPTKAGYLEWWTPEFEIYLSEYLSK